jgi:hypothetical protein
MCGKTCHLWADFRCVGRPFIHGKMFHAWEDFIDMGRSHRWEGFPNMGRLHGKSSHPWEDFPPMGDPLINGRSSHRWEVFPFMGRLPTSRKSFHRVWPPIYECVCVVQNEILGESEFKFSDLNSQVFRNVMMCSICWEIY